MIRVWAVLATAAAVVSCAVEDVPASNPGRVRDALLDRVVAVSYRAIGDRHIDPPDFRKLAPETWRGFAQIDDSLKIEMGASNLRLFQGERVIAERSLPASSSDTRAWSMLLGELFDVSFAASPALRAASSQTLTKSAMNATVKQLDRNSRYADPDEARDARFSRDGGGGVGITLSSDPGETRIIAVQEGAPAGRAGVRADDRIVAIDGARVEGKAMRDIVRTLRGRIGDPVSLTVRRPSEGRDLTFALVRAEIVPTTVTWQRRGDVAHVKVEGFNKATSSTFDKALKQIRDEMGSGLAGLILDFRDNPGGLLDQSLMLSDQLLSEGLVMTTEGRHNDSRQTFRATGGAAMREIPMVALINGRSASASEIVVAALQDRGRAVVVGSVSYGKGTVQTVVRLPNEGELTLTWSRLHSPAGWSWNDVGVLPNICSVRVADPAQAAAAVEQRAAETRRMLSELHAVRRPLPERVAELRSTCPPSDQKADVDLQIADRLLHDRTLYARALEIAAPQSAQR